MQNSILQLDIGNASHSCREASEFGKAEPKVA